MRPDDLSPADHAQLAARGIAVATVQRQLAQLTGPPPCVQLERPCIPGDGILVLPETQVAAARQAYEAAAAAGRLLKFVPASGAATRMFRSLLAAGTAETENALERQVFLDGLRRFAFFDDLAAAMHRDGLDPVALAAQGQIDLIVDFLLTPRGLDYVNQPKGLLQFHRYPDANRTAFEEHLVEAVGHVRDQSGTCRLHFTISPQHRGRFLALLDRARPAYEARYHVRFDVSFSEQKPSTDTIAVDENNRPIRAAGGRLLFRPGGHGALIENLDDLRGDIICVKNIDNIVPDHLREPTLKWKRILTGLLAARQRTIFEHVARLSGVPTPEEVQAALRFIAGELAIAVPPAATNAWALAVLNRPLRVCGMVKNTGEPGGGPFWVRASDGSISRQIVESAQVDPQSPDQQAVFRSATHFNPVDLVCGVRNWRGERFDLRRYVDVDAVFIAHKSEGGRSLKALELPGLWNGAMADWITLFVEVPIETFNPVKTVNDLLRPQHQPAE
jgi:hypothetical protein